MSSQARFDPDRVEAFAERLKVYARTLDDYDSQVANALSRLGETFDDADYQDLCVAFAQMRSKLRDMVDGSVAEISRIESMCADVRASQAVSTRS